MKRFQFSILNGMVATCYVGVSLAALIHPSRMWMYTFHAIVALSLLTAILAATHRRGDSRTFWLGFCVFGWGYFVLVHGPFSRLELPTTALLERVADGVFQGKRDWLLPPPIIDPAAPVRTWSQEEVDAAWDYDAFVDIGHAVFTLPFGIVGGILSQLLTPRRN